ncbi:malto-oligosyltrehalose trehalohydrolase [Acidisoma cellulosilytica]|uniref:Malto-oligosyltrehalose trehalohydrolase n=1 Tax=Acidisoma cellulosilyticum TaxID=2802395 RepID=A0A964E206_9PROT|nr:malto-oligosyltrehalose trehalohydrolase [Acidisoma cellulosilyticum]MCB8878792.1 malto-oligosyltrehalose trehalohydrolase [Acidisoma cellulosilyticum]
MTTRVHDLPFGASLQGDGVLFRFWAPGEAEVSIALDGGEPLPMTAGEDGWHEKLVPNAKAGSVYHYVVKDGLRVPDPASRFQPQDVHGPSEVIDPEAYDWQDGSWRGRDWAEAVIYELHIGTFTPEGSFRAAIARLDHLADLGVTVIEIMPVADFPGQRNWGYDGVLPFAPDSSYGRPEDFKALVDAAHARGLSVMLDVVYNHFGPDGNYLPVYAPQFFTERHKSPWGAGINVDGADSRPVRDFFIHNALYWIKEFHLDGLRFDAVHAIQDDSPRHLLLELAETLRAQVQDRPLHLVLENEDNRARYLERTSNGQPRDYSAQWNDDVHHVLHVAATGEDVAYYAPYAQQPELLGRALAEGFAFQGEAMAYSGKPRGEPSAHLPPSAFVAFAQNHDQIGNRAMGERLSQIASAEAVRAVSAVYLLLPQVPMLFMGEELGATSPFLFFADFEGELAEKVRDGRREEFARFPAFSDPETREKIPDPLAEATFLASKLQWDKVDPTVQDWYRRILAVRRERLLPLLHGIRQGGRARMRGQRAVEVVWTVDGGGALTLLANLSSETVSGDFAVDSQPLWQEGAAAQKENLPAWSVRWMFSP